MRRDLGHNPALQTGRFTCAPVSRGLSVHNSSIPGGTPGPRSSWRQLCPLGSQGSAAAALPQPVLLLRPGLPHYCLYQNKHTLGKKVPAPPARTQAFTEFYFKSGSYKFSAFPTFNSSHIKKKNLNSKLSGKEFILMDSGLA